MCADFICKCEKKGLHNSVINIKTRSYGWTTYTSPIILTFGMHNLHSKVMKSDNCIVSGNAIPMG